MRLQKSELKCSNIIFDNYKYKRRNIYSSMCNNNRILEKELTQILHGFPLISIDEVGLLSISFLGNNVPFIAEIHTRNYNSKYYSI